MECGYDAAMVWDSAVGAIAWQAWGMKAWTWSMWSACWGHAPSEVIAPPMEIVVPPLELVVPPLELARKQKYAGWLDAGVI